MDGNLNVCSYATETYVQDKQQFVFFIDLP